MDRNKALEPVFSHHRSNFKMPAKMTMIFGASNILWIMFAVSQAFTIETSPESRVLAQIGDSVSLTCSTTGCESPSFSWRTQIDSPLNAKVRNEGTKSTLTMDPVSFENEHSYLCTATCGSRKEEKEIQVDVYSFPKDPEIHFGGLLEVGKPITVKCLVPDVYPFDRLEMELFKGDSHVKTQEFLEDMDKKSLETKSLEVTFTSTIEDIGKAFICRAKLHITETDSEESSPKERETNKELQVYISPKNTAVSVHPSTRLREGDPVTMTCSSEGLPAPEIVWSKKLNNGNLQLLSGNATLTLIAMKMEDSGIYVCEGVNQIGRNSKEVELIVQERPFTVDVFPGYQVAAQLGDSVVLTCSVTDCESPSFSWRTQGDGPLSGMVRSEGTESTVTLSSVSFENEDQYLCTVMCGQRKVEKEIQVELYSFPQDPAIEMSGLLVNGDPVTVSCKVPFVYPFDHLEIEIHKGETLMVKKYFSEKMDIKSLKNKSLETTFTPTNEDTGTVLVCQAKLHIGEMESEPKQRQSSQTLYVSVAPTDMTVLVNPSSVLEEGSSVNMTCTSSGLPAPKIQWSRQLSNGALQPLSENATLTLISTKMEDSGIYVCEGINQAGIGRKKVELTIQVTPKDIQLTAFPSKSVKEGDMVVISCTCGNVPETWIILKKKTETGDTVLKSIDGAYTIHKVQLEDAGVYECESKNKVGSELRSLTLDVKVPPRNLTISVHPSRNVKEGENITITCKTFSHPPAVIILKRVDLANEVTICSNNGTFTLYHVTQNDSGVYVISASNEVGDDSGRIEISVMRRENNKDYFSPELLVLYCTFSLIIPAVGMIIYFARKANMKGSYSLVEAQKSKV